DQARDGRALGAGNLDALASDLLEKLAQRRVRGQVDGETLQCFFKRVAVVVAHCADATGTVLEDETFEEVVDGSFRKLQIEASLAIDLAGSGVVANATAEKDDPRDGQIGRFGFVGARHRAKDQRGGGDK